MSAKLAIGATVDEAFRFGMRRWGTVIRYAWAPVLASIVIAVGYFTAIINPAAFPGLEGATELSELGAAFRFPMPAVIAGGVAVYALCFLLMSGVVASLYRLVALGEERDGFFHFRLDGPAWRVFWSIVIFSLITGFIWVAALVAASAISGESLRGLFSGFMSFATMMGEMEEGAAAPPEVMETLNGWLRLNFLALAIAAVPLLYVGIKLTPFSPGSAVENRLLLFGAFRMTFGHFWSILIAYILFFVMAIILAVIFQIATSILQLIATALGAQGAAAGVIGAIMGVVILIVSIIYQAFMAGVQAALPAIVYRRLTTGA